MALVTATEIKTELEGICEVESGLVSDSWIEGKRDKFIVPWVIDKTGLNIGSEETVEEYYDGNGENFIILNRKPINELVKIEYVSSADYTAELSLTQFLLIGEEGIIKAVRTENIIGMNFPVFPKGNRNIKVTYKTGWDTADIPDKINEIIKYLVCEKILMFVANRTGGGNISTNGYSRQYGDRGKYTDLRNEYTRMAYSLLDDYLTGVVS